MREELIKWIDIKQAEKVKILQKKAIKYIWKETRENYQARAFKDKEQAKNTLINIIGNETRYTIQKGH